jgi:hypothetical protein
MVEAAFRLLLKNTPKKQKKINTLDLKYFLKITSVDLKNNITILFNI